MERFPSTPVFADYPHLSEGGSPVQDYELFPPDSRAYAGPWSDASYIHPQKQLSPMDAPPKSPFLTPVPWYGSSMLPQGLPHGKPAPMSDHSSWGSDLSTTSGADSPRSTSSGWVGGAGCYMSPPYTSDDAMLQVPDHWGCPSPVASSYQSVSPAQIYYPDPEPIVSLGAHQVPLMRDTPPALVYPTAPQPEEHQLPVLGLVPEHDAEDLVSSPLSQSQSRRQKTKRSSGGVVKDITARKDPAQTTGSASRPVTKPRSKKGSSTPSRIFICSFSHYGCPSTFTSKNEWKRHVSSQHVKVGFYRCDIGRCNADNLRKLASARGASHDEARLFNDFNRKDLFTQHQRRMHSPWVTRNSKQPVTSEERQAFEETLEGVRDRCWQQQRAAPEHSRCGFCGHQFSGHLSWNDRMEHVGRHFEKGDFHPHSEQEDPALRQWAIEEGVIESLRGQWRLTSDMK